MNDKACQYFLFPLSSTVIKSNEELSSKSSAVNVKVGPAYSLLTRPVELQQTLKQANLSQPTQILSQQLSRLWRCREDRCQSFSSLSLYVHATP